MDIVRTVIDMHRLADQERIKQKKMALVPTMGALHKGHLRLVEYARELADHVTVSIFVNPTQFGPNEDFSKYPREQEKDIALLTELGGVDTVFMPDSRQLYPNGQEGHVSWVTVDKLGQHLCGKYRDGHFLGVTTVVSKLFNCCKPHVACFGLKDAQQYLILRRMVKDLNFDIDVVGVPTYREEDGLAASSRNIYLDSRQRSEAPQIHKALTSIKKMIESGERNGDTLRRHLSSFISDRTQGIVQYAEVVDTEYIQPLDELPADQEVLVAVAVFLGKTRLIDNVFVKTPPA